MDKIDYWIECAKTCCEEASIKVGDEQIKLMADVIKTSHENIGLAFGYVENPLIEENKTLKQKLQIEIDKVACHKCRGKGIITDSCGGITSISRCDKCDGDGKLSKHNI